jgi:hypothetical protein
MFSFIILHGRILSFPLLPRDIYLLQDTPSIYSVHNFGLYLQSRFQKLFKTKKRFGLVILNYTGTSIHIRLPVVDNKGFDVIPNTINWIAGRTGPEFNQPSTEPVDEIYQESKLLSIL